MIHHRRLIENTSYIVLRAEYGPVILLTAISHLGMGLWLLNPAWKTFEAASTSYRLMGGIAPEEVWGAWMLLLGLGMGLAMFYRAGARARQTTVFLSAMTYFLLTALFVWSNIAVLGVPLFATGGLASSLAFLRVRMEGKSA